MVRDLVFIVVFLLLSINLFLSDNVVFYFVRVLVLISFVSFATSFGEIFIFLDFVFVEIIVVWKYWFVWIKFFFVSFKYIFVVLFKLIFMRVSRAFVVSRKASSVSMVWMCFCARCVFFKFLMVCDDEFLFIVSFKNWIDFVNSLLFFLSIFMLFLVRRVTFFFARKVVNFFLEFFAILLGVFEDFIFFFSFVLYLVMFFVFVVLMKGF